MNKAVGYVRVSQQDKENPSDTLNTQTQIITDYAKYHNLELTHIYNEGIEKSYDWNRVEFNNMKDAAFKHEFNTLLIKDETRLARDIALLVNLCKDFKALGIKIITVTTGEDIVSNEVMLGIKASIASDVISKGRLNQSLMMERKMKEGVPFGCPPYGYLAVKKSWEPDRVKLNEVKHCFDLYLAGFTLKQIAQKTGLYINRVKRILLNKIYTGTFVIRIKKKGAENKLIDVEIKEYQLKDFDVVISPEMFRVVEDSLLHNKPIILPSKIVSASQTTENKDIEVNDSYS